MYMTIDPQAIALDVNGTPVFQDASVAQSDAAALSPAILFVQFSSVQQTKSSVLGRTIARRGGRHDSGNDAVV